MRLAGIFIVTAVVLTAAVGPWLVRFDPSAQELALRLEGPSRLHWFGLDEL
jgi:peptide/nickel transport system permease protein